MVFSSIVFKYILPQDSSGIKNKNLKKATILISILIAILSSIFLPIVIPHLFPQYIETVEAIQIISFSVIPGTISMLYTSKFLALEKSKYVLMSKILTIVIMIIGFITLGPIFGIIGLAITLVISTSADAFYLVLVNKFRERNNE